MGARRKFKKIGVALGGPLAKRAARALSDEDEPQERGKLEGIEASYRDRGNQNMDASTTEASVSARPSRRVTVPTAPTESATAPNYELHPPFLLEVETGRVWRFDDERHAMMLVPRQSTPIERTAQAVVMAEVAAELATAARAEAFTTREEFERVQPLMDAYLKTVQDHADKLAGPDDLI